MAAPRAPDEHGGGCEDGGHTTIHYETLEALAQKNVQARRLYCNLEMQLGVQNRSAKQKYFEIENSESAES